jgi:hypothetical protein
MNFNKRNKIYIGIMMNKQMFEEIDRNIRFFDDEADGS